MSLGEFLHSWQWINVSSKSKTNVFFSVNFNEYKKIHPLFLGKFIYLDSKIF